MLAVLDHALTLGRLEIEPHPSDDIVFRLDRTGEEKPAAVLGVIGLGVFRQNFRRVVERIASAHVVKMKSQIHGCPSNCDFVMV